MMSVERRLSVLCVDDNAQLAAALRIRLASTGDLAWAGWLADADDLQTAVERDCPAVVILDLEMPGKDPFVALHECTRKCPSSRIVVYSAHVDRPRIDRAFEAGAWGFVSKNDGHEALLGGIHDVMEGRLAMSKEVRDILGVP